MRFKIVVVTCSLFAFILSFKYGCSQTFLKSPNNLNGKIKSLKETNYNFKESGNVVTEDGLANMKHSNFIFLPDGKLITIEIRNSDETLFEKYTRKYEGENILSEVVTNNLDKRIGSWTYSALGNKCFDYVYKTSDEKLQLSGKYCLTNGKVASVELIQYSSQGTVKRQQTYSNLQYDSYGSLKKWDFNDDGNVVEVPINEMRYLEFDGNKNWIKAVNMGLGILIKREIQYYE